MDSYMLQFALEGVDQSVDPALLSFNRVADAVNVQIKDSTLTCRPGVKIHELDIEGDFQGATFYNPAKGLSQQSFGVDTSGIVARIGGKHYRIVPSKSKPASTTLDVTALDSEDTASNESYHLAFLKQCENYVISQDGNGSTWIWDGQNPPYFSSGYDSTNKEESKLANGASAVAYAHGRIVQVVNLRQVIVGDIIHKSEFTTASNILETTEQTYWATGAFFSPPSELGTIRAVEVLPLQDTAHGHGDLMFHTSEGIFSLDLTLYPRDTWVDQAIVKHVLLDTGAAGFYAICLMAGDQFFLSRHGLQTLRSARAESSLVGNPFNPISESVRDYIDADTRDNFIYASVEKFVEQRRIFLTTQHLVRGGARGGRGLLVLNTLPVVGGNRAWEGLWTFPSEGRLINQLISGVFDTQERMFAFATGADGKVRLLEFSDDLPNDVLSDGTEKPIEWQVLTREDTAGDSAECKTIEKAWATIRRASGPLEWEVFSRTDVNDWELWHSGCADAESCDLESPIVRDLKLRFGSPPQATKTGTRHQMLLRFKGCAALEAIKMSSSFDRGGNSTPTSESGCVVLTSTDPKNCTYDPFSYSNE